MKHLKNILLFLSLLLTSVPRMVPTLFTAVAPAVSVSVVGPTLSALPAVAGAVAIVAALSEEAEAITIRALNWEKDNNAANSDIRLVWADADSLPRAEHTIIWRVNHHGQTGYHAVWWHAPSGSFTGSNYYFGSHPLPTDDCTVNGTGALLTGNSGSSTHCWEIAAAGYDWGRASGASPGYAVTKSRWYVQARRSHLATDGPCNGEYENVYWLDLETNPSDSIVKCLADVSGGGANPLTYLGGSEWSVTGNANSETLAGKIRSLQMYNVALSKADIVSEAANHTSNTPVTSAGVSNVWYMNQDPTVADVTDKSGAGHDPAWANANRPTDWDSTYSTGSAASFRGTLLGVGR